MPPAPLRPSKSARVLGTTNACDASPFDQHKRNVRRPPRGIQNWFDAFSSSGDENEEDEEERVEDAEDDGDDDDDDAMDEKHDSGIHEPPQADAFPRATRHGPAISSRVPPGHLNHQFSPRSLEPRMIIHRDPRDMKPSRPQTPGSVCSTSETVRLEHFPQARARHEHQDPKTSWLRNNSTMSLLSQYNDDDKNHTKDVHCQDDKYDETDSDESDLPDIRASIIDDQIVVFGAAEVQRIQPIRPPRDSSLSSMSPKQSIDNISRTSSIVTEIQLERCEPAPSIKSNGRLGIQARKDIDRALSTEDFTSSSSISSESHEVATQNEPTTAETSGPHDVLRNLPGVSDDSHPMAMTPPKPRNASTPDIGRMIVVTEEEMALLEAIRTKKTVKHSPSETESSERRFAPAQSPDCTMKAMTFPSPPPKSEQRRSTRKDSGMPFAGPSPIIRAENRRQLSSTQRTRTEERLSHKEQRDPTPINPPRLELKSISPELYQTAKHQSQVPPPPPVDEVLSPTVYKPLEARHRTRSQPPASEFDESHRTRPKTQETKVEAQQRVELFIATKGAPPPLHTSIKSMRRDNSLVPPLTTTQEVPMPTSPPKTPIRPKTSIPRKEVPHNDGARRTSTFPAGLGMGKILRKSTSTHFQKMQMPAPLSSHPVETMPRLTQPPTPEISPSTIRRLPWEAYPASAPASAIGDHRRREDRHPELPKSGTNKCTDNVSRPRATSGRHAPPVLGRGEDRALAGNGSARARNGSRSDKRSTGDPAFVGISDWKAPWE